MRQVLLFFFNLRHLEKNKFDLFKRLIKFVGFGYISFFTCKNQNCEKISQISCFHFTSECFHAKIYPKDFTTLSKALHCESYPIWKSCFIIRFKWEQEVYPTWIS